MVYTMYGKKKTEKRLTCSDYFRQKKVLDEDFQTVKDSVENYLVLRSTVKSRWIIPVCDTE